MGSFLNTLAQYEASKSPMGQAAYYAATGTQLTPQQIAAAQGTNPGLALANSIIGRYRRGGANGSIASTGPQGPPAPTTTTPTQPTQGTDQVKPLDLIDDYSSTQSEMPKQDVGIGPAPTQNKINISLGAGNGSYSGGRPPNIPAPSQGSSGGVPVTTTFPGGSTDTSGGMIPVTTSWPPPSNQPAQTDGSTTGVYYGDVGSNPDPSNSSTPDPSSYPSYPGDENSYGGGGGNFDDGSGMDAGATGAMMGKGGGVMKIGEAGPEMAGGRIVTSPTYVHLDKGETVIPLTPSSKNKMQPDLLEGHVAQPKVPGVNFSRYQRYGTGRGLMR